MLLLEPEPVPSVVATPSLRHRPRLPLPHAAVFPSPMLPRSPCRPPKDPTLYEDPTLSVVLLRAQPHPVPPPLSVAVGRRPSRPPAPSSSLSCLLPFSRVALLVSFRGWRGGVVVLSLAGATLLVPFRGWREAGGAHGGAWRGSG